MPSTGPEDHYTPDYYASFSDGSARSAAIVLPIALDQLAAGRPRSVIDLGCGQGAWLAVWRSLGVPTVRGVDGEWVAVDRLAIPADCLTRHDLETPFRPTERYDLAMSLEAAEHLSADAAPGLVDALCASAPVVLFSAATPNMNGEHHVNCQWPSYWADFFRERHGYQCVDSLRPLIWTDERVDWWYRQDLMWFVSDPGLLADAIVTPSPLPLVHPELLKEALDWGVELERKYWDLYAETHPTDS